MAREYQNGDGFGYILSFRQRDTQTWTIVRVPGVESSRFVYTNQTLTPYSPFEVKIKAYNRMGEGPFSQVAQVYSAEEGTRIWTKSRPVFDLTHITETLCVISMLALTNTDRTSRTSRTSSFFNAWLTCY